MSSILWLGVVVFGMASIGLCYWNAHSLLHSKNWLQILGVGHRLVRLKFAAFFSLLLRGGWLEHLAWKKVEAYIKL